jgi:hypothetical protein
MKDFKTNIAGDLGEDFAEQYCKANKISFKKATRKEDLEQGIDAYINGEPTDIKNTKNLYIFQIYDDGIIHVRHPFKSISKATHYFFVNVTKDKTEFIEHIEIFEKLIRDFVKFKEDGEYLCAFQAFLKSIDVRHYSEFGPSLEQACLELKKKILPFLNKDINVTYPDIKSDVIDFKLMKKDEIKKPTAFDLDAIRARIKGGTKKTEKWVSPNSIKPIVTVTIVEEEVEDLIIIKL